MSIRSIVTAALACALFAAPAAAQDAAEIYRLEEIVVEGRRLETLAAEFVREVAAAPPGRGPARWREGVCIGAANFELEIAQYLIDRVSDVARDLGLRAGQPGCHPSILIIGTADGATFARQFVDMRPRLFRVGGSGMDRGAAALEDFMSADRAVRWWHVSVPTDAETGERAVRLPGDYQPMPHLPPEQDVFGYAPLRRVAAASNIQTSLEDVLARSFVVIDVERLEGVTLQQLGDYVAMVALVQVDPAADTSRYETILNLFNDPQGIDGLSGWDLAYMQGIYTSRAGRIHAMHQVQSVTAAILSAYRGRIGSQDSDRP